MEKIINVVKKPCVWVTGLIVAAIAGIVTWFCARK